MPVEQGVSKPLHPDIIIIQRVVNRVFFNCNRNYVTSTARSVITDINNAKKKSVLGSYDSNLVNLFIAVLKRSNR